MTKYQFMAYKFRRPQNRDEVKALNGITKMTMLEVIGVKKIKNPWFEPARLFIQML